MKKKSNKNNIFNKLFKLLVLFHAFPLVTFALVLRLNVPGPTERKGGGFFDLIHLMTDKPDTWKKMGMIVILEILNIYLWSLFYDLYTHFI